MAGTTESTEGGTPVDQSYVIVTGYRCSEAPVQHPPTEPGRERPTRRIDTTEAPTVYPDANRAPYPTYEQVTRPSIYPFTLASVASPGEGVDPEHASAASFRVIDPDRGTGDPTARIDVVRISALSEAGRWAGHDIWLTWQEPTKSWEHADDPRYRGTIDAGPHMPPESWTLEREVEVIETFDYDSVEPLSQELPDIEPPDGLDLE